MMKDRATTKQLVTVIFVTGMTLKVFLLPTLLLKAAGRDGLIVLIVLLAAEMLVLAAALFAVGRSPGLTLTETLQKYFTPVGSRIAAVALAGYACLKLILLFTEARSFFGSSLFEEFFWPVMSLPLFGLVALVAAKSLSGIARLFELFAPLVFASLVILVVIIAPNIHFANALPLGGAGAGTVAWQALTFPVWTGDFVLILLFMGKTRPRGKFVLWGAVSALIGIAFVLFFAVALTAAFGNIPHLLEYGHNMRNLAVFGTGNLNYGRLDIILYAVWAIGLIIKLFLYAYFAVTLLAFTCRLNTANRRLILSGVLMLALYILTATAFASNSAAYEFARGWPRWFGLGVQIAAAAGAVVLGIVWRKNKRAKREEKA